MKKFKWVLGTTKNSRKFSVGVTNAKGNVVERNPGLREGSSGPGPRGNADLISVVDKYVMLSESDA